MARAYRRERRRREDEEPWWERVPLWATLLLWVTGLMPAFKLFEFLENLFHSKKNEYRRDVRGRSNSGKIWYFLKKVGFAATVIFGIVLAGFLVFNTLQEQIFYQWRSPVDMVSGGVSNTVNATTTAINSVVLGIKTTMIYRPACQRKYLQENPENYELEVRNCVRTKQGLPTINESREGDGEWELQRASNYLSISTSTEVTEGEFIQDACGSRCGVFHVTVVNSGSKELELEDMGAYITGQRMKGKYPLIVMSDKTSSKGRRDIQKEFVLGSNKLGDWETLGDIDNNVLILRPDEERTFTYLFNMSAHETFSVEEVRERLENYVSAVETNTEEEPTVEEYCSDRGGVYDGDAVLWRGGEVRFESSPVSVSFESFSGSVCVDHVEGSVKNSVRNIMGSEIMTPHFFVNYSSTTEAPMNLKVWNQDEWLNMDRRVRNNQKAEHCSRIGTGTTLRQTSQRDSGDVVGFLMYTNCEVIYSSERTDNQAIIEIQAKADSSKVDSFRVNSLDGLSGGSDAVCDQFIGGTDPEQAYTGTDWFELEAGDWNSPTTACYIDLPQVENEATLNLGLEADFSVRASETGSFRLN